MHIIPLILIILILVLILCIQLPSISLCTGRSAKPEVQKQLLSMRENKVSLSFFLGPQPEIPDEEQSLLLRDDEGQIRQEDQLPSARDHIIDRLTAEIDHLKDANARKADDVKKLQRELSTSVSQNTDLQRRCETLLRDLEGARLFLNTADTFADSEVIQMLEKLNAELQHTATFMVDRVVSVFKLDAMTSDPAQQIVANSASESIGSTLVQFLRNPGRDDSEVQMYLQIAFQAYLTNHLCWIVSSWTFDQGHNAFINEIYQSLRDTGKTFDVRVVHISADGQRMVDREAGDIWTLAFPHARLCPSDLCQRTEFLRLPCHFRAF